VVIDSGCVESAPPVSVLIATRNRVHALSRCLESVLIQDYSNFEILIHDDFSEQDISTLIGDRFPDARIRWLRSEKRLGVTGARNRLIQEAKGSILVTIDDDAVLSGSQSISRVVDHLQNMSQVGILAFKIITFKGDSSELWLPFSRRALCRQPDLFNQRKFVSYYVGTGHAIRREVFERSGLYQDDFVFYGEEVDLSYRAIESGFAILYVPDVIVHHFPEPSVLGNQDGQGELYFTVRNRLWLAYKYLPWRYFPTHITFWLVYYGLNALATRRFREFLSALRRGFSDMRTVKRCPLSKRAIHYVEENFGRLWY